MNPFVFVVGAPRSGTTLLKRMLDAHPELMITRETHWITELMDGRHAASPDEPVTPELLERLLGHERFRRLELDSRRLEALVAREEPVPYAELVSTVFDLCGEQTGKPLVGDKTPRYVRHIPVLNRLWPEAKFVHLIRDGRAVCLSVRNWEREKRMVTRFSTYAEDPVSTIAVWWEQLVRLGREAGAELPGELYHEVRYEALVADPAGELSGLCDFLGIRYDERMVRFHEGRTRSEPGLSVKKAWRPVTPGLRDWRSEMPAEDVERFEAVAGGLLDELGYERGVPEPRGEALRHAALVRDSYVREAGGQRLPAAWASAV